MKKTTGILVTLGIIFILLHSTPKMALRYHIFFSGYPIKALTTDIYVTKIDNEFDNELLNKLNANSYTLTKPPFEKATEAELDTFLVKKRAFLYFAEYYSLL